MSKSYDDYEGRFVDALRAIVARIEGQWDHPALTEYGPLSTSTTDDILRIASEALNDAD